MDSEGLTAVWVVGTVCVTLLLLVLGIGTLMHLDKQVAMRNGYEQRVIVGQSGLAWVKAGGDSLR